MSSDSSSSLNDSYVSKDGYTCTGCGIHTEISHCDVRLGALCLECRQDWDKACEPELRIIKTKPVPEVQNNVIDSSTNLLDLLNDFRDEQELPHFKIHPLSQELAETYIDNHWYKLTENINHLNQHLKSDRWINLEMIVKYIPFPSGYNVITDLFTREISTSMLESGMCRQVGIKSDSTGVCLVVSQKYANSGTES